MDDLSLALNEKTPPCYHMSPEVKYGRIADPWMNCYTQKEKHVKK